VGGGGRNAESRETSKLATVAGKRKNRDETYEQTSNPGLVNELRKKKKKKEKKEHE
jgi:hypothetical protein